MEPKRQFQDIVRPQQNVRQPLNPPTAAAVTAPVVTPAPETLPPSTESLIESVSLETSQPIPPKKKRPIWKWLVGGIIAMATLMLAGAAGAYYWYQAQLGPVNAQATGQTVVTIQEGSTVPQIATALKDKNLIKNTRAFSLYVKKKNAILHPGPYRIDNNATVEQIVKKLQNAQVDEFDVMFLPGATVKDAQKVLEKAGYTTDQVSAALAATYDYPILQAAPKGAGLEGFVYGETYRFNSNATAEDVISRAIGEMQRYINKENLEAAFKKQNMTLYEGIILASIIQKEVSNKDDMARVSQVFHKRMKEGMSLGSDVTFMYGAEKLGVAATTDLDSPYNTRVHTGLPPTPIANPGAAALYAAAHPATGDYLFFVAGDDGVTYFSKTNEEHERLTAQHCHKNCEIPDNGY